MKVFTRLYWYLTKMSIKLMVIFLRLVFKQDFAESERQIAIAVHSRSSIEAVVTTGVPGFVTVGHGAP